MSLQDADYPQPSFAPPYAPKSLYGDESQYRQSIESDPEGGADAADFWFYFADGSSLFLQTGAIFEDYDPEVHDQWSIKFPVAGGAINTSGTIVAEGAAPDLYDGDAYADPVTPQTFYRIPLIRGYDTGDGVEPRIAALGGVYRENIFCDASKGPIVELIKIG